MKPTYRNSCLSFPRPCCFITCSFHMLWAFHSHELKNLFTHSDDDIVNHLFSLKATCVLDIADKGGVTLEEIAIVLDVSRERIRQIIDGSQSNRTIGAIDKLQQNRKFPLKSLEKQYLTKKDVYLLTEEDRGDDGVYNSSKAREGKVNE